MEDHRVRAIAGMKMGPLPRRRIRLEKTNTAGLRSCDGTYLFPI
jgi:hypothetical protein